MDTKDDLILRDYLAGNRTILANERTFLAYLRTSISFLATGLGVLKYINENFFIKILGCVLISFAIFTLIFGTKRFLKTARPLKKKFIKNYKI